VTVISRNADNLKELTDLGAVAATGSVEDVAFLTKTFTGADAVYTMVPPKMDAPDWKAYIGQIGKNYADAVRRTGVSSVVNLSSIGGHLAQGGGPVSGLYRVEQELNKLQNVNIRHLRPSYFYQNLLANLGMIKHAGFIGGNFDIKGNRFPIVDPSDIAEAAAEELLSLNFEGHTVRYIASDEVSTNGIAQALGNAIRKPDLKWVPFTDEQAFQGMTQAGLSEEVAKNYTEMNAALNSGALTEDYWKNRGNIFGKVKLNDFAQQFAGAYNAS
jgi:uncharacterized protein YbjT (DUF2867 family)